MLNFEGFYHHMHHLQPKVLLAAVFVTALVTALEGTTFAVALALDLRRWKNQ